MDLYAQKQGDLITVHNLMSAKHPVTGTKKEHKRGKIKKFSKNSKMRLKTYLVKLKKKNMLFVTLTYAENVTDNEKAKKDLHNFCRQLSKYSSKIWFVWKMEFQKRGAIHYHLIVGGVKYRVFYQLLKKHWQKGFWTLSTANKTVLYYFSKYILKDVKVIEDMAGRFWGVFNKLAVDIEEIKMYKLDNLQIEFFKLVFQGLRKDHYNSKVNIYT